LAQAGFFPVVIMAIREWFPVDRRGFASSIITACMSVGALLATAMTTRLMKQFGWRDTFLIYSALGAAWSLWFIVWFRNSPRQHRHVNAQEMELIEAHSQNIASTHIHNSISTNQAIKALALSPGMWALCAQTFFQSFSYALFITWYPSYLEKGRGLTVTRAGDAATVNLFMEVVGSILGGLLIDRIYRQTGRKWKSRSLMPALTLGICSILTAAAGLFSNPLPAIVLVSAGMFFTGLGKTGKWSCTIDLASGHTALAFAIMNMAGNVGAWLSPKVVGDMFKKLAESGGNWNQFLWLVAIVQLAAAISCFVLNPDKPAIGSGD
ncbi:MAG: MFS transporter, partial [bacterium]